MDTASDFESEDRGFDPHRGLIFSFFSEEEECPVLNLIKVDFFPPRASVLTFGGV